MRLPVIGSTGKVGRLGRRTITPFVGALALVAMAVVPALASTPTILRESLVRDRAFIDCPSGGTLWGHWDVNRSTTTWTDESGAPVRDIFAVRFSGYIYNPVTGQSVPDSGNFAYHDEFAPDGSFASSLYVYQRTDVYLHEAGQQLLGPSDANGNQDTLRTAGMSHFNADGIAAICAALGA